MAEATSVSSGSGRGGSPSFVVAGATVTCKEGSKEAHLMNMSFGSVDIGMMQGLTKDDKAIQENDFGICKKLSEKYEKEKDEKKEIQCKPEFLEWSNTESLTTFTTIETLTLNSKLSCDCTSPESISILDSGQGGGGSNGNSILPQLNDAALGMNPLQQYGYLAVGSSGLLIMVKGAGGAIVSAVGWPVLLAGGVIFVFYGLSKINNGVTVMGPPAWAMGSTGVTTIGKVYDRDGNVISSIPGYTNPYGNVTTQNPAKDVGNGITLGPRPEDMAAGGMYTGIYPSVSLNSLANEVASSLGGVASQLKNGYKVEIPNGRKSIVVRIMNEVSGGRGNPYYRVSIDGKGSLTSDGIISSDRGLTHIDLSENSMSEIIDIINNYSGRK
ncbi:PAAR-like protein [Enterococcus sp. CWB-B31]|uniref:PAAR-like protein n=1 Tax=Enterococcus sp. CWB-B31 TaxID=2885159 RepID=UPI00226D1B34|nr:PAAR-like protein [Enterococcus sp. CWB-B31]MCB5954245.1 DUF4280 domain-containing protein [Enterococcus sp. CWB-B31]